MRQNNDSANLNLFPGRPSLELILQESMPVDEWQDMTLTGRFAFFPLPREAWPLMPSPS